MVEKLVVSTLEPVRQGDQFDSLPLHCTLMPWFDIEQKGVPELHKWLGVIAAKLDSLQLTGEDIAMFGPREDVKVRKVARTPELVRLHADISAAIAWSGGSQKSDYIHENYNPHVSFTEGVAPKEGEVVEITGFQLIDRNRQSRIRTVEKVFTFGEV